MNSSSAKFSIKFSPRPIQYTIRNVCPLLYLSIGLSVLISTYLALCAWSVCKLQYQSVVCMSLFLCHRRKPISQWTQDIWLNNVLLILAYLQTIQILTFKKFCGFGVLQVSLLCIIGELVGGGVVLWLLVLVTCGRCRQRIRSTLGSWLQE